MAGARAWAFLRRRCTGASKPRFRIIFLWTSFAPVPAADFGNQIVTSQVEVKRRDRDVALTKTQDIRIRSGQVIRRIIREPVVSPTARVLTPLEGFSISAQAHGNYTDALG